MNLFAILFIGFADSIGMGLIIPILPKLVESIDVHHVIQHYGIFLSLYAFFKLIFAPILGSWSDRFKRKPILLLSLSGAIIDYLIMGFAQKLIYIYIARIIAGITAANVTIANSMLADITEPKNRIKRYSWLHGCMGLGYTIGPALGGFLSKISIHTPCFVAASTSVLCCFFSLFFLQETHNKHFQKKTTNASVFLKQIQMPIFIFFAILMLAAYSPNVLWSLYTKTSLHWDLSLIGLSYAAFGLAITLSRGIITPFFSQLIGVTKTLLLAIILEIISNIILAFTIKTWIILSVVLSFSAIGSIWEPLLHGQISKTVNEDLQGLTQGHLTCISSIAGLIAPLLTTNFYAYTKCYMPGAVWLLIALLYTISLWFIINICNKP